MIAFAFGELCYNPTAYQRGTMRACRGEKDNSGNCDSVVLSVTSICHRKCPTSASRYSFGFRRICHRKLRTALRRRAQTGSGGKAAFLRNRVGYCVCSTKLLVGEMDERDLKTLEAGKVGDLLPGIPSS